MPFGAGAPAASAGTVPQVPWDEGEVVVLRELLDGRVRSARPLRVVADRPDVFAGYLVPRSTVAWPRLVGEEQSQTPDQGWRLRREEWQGPGSLFVIPSGAAYAAVSFLDRDDGRHLGWKIDFLRPPTRQGGHLDTLDWAFDLMVEPGLSRWRDKDADDLGQLCRLGLLTADEQAQLVEARHEVLRQLRTGGAFADWAAWRPPPDAAPLDLPCGWDQAPPPPAPGPTARLAARRGARVQLPADSPPARLVARSGRGHRLLDAEGRVWLDADLAGGVLLHGHAHPAVVEAVTRQAGLALAVGHLHEGEVALAEVLAERFPPVERVLSRASAGEAWRAAGTIARRATGRRVVATWRSEDVGLDAFPSEVMLLPEDTAQASARLTLAGGRLAAVSVDPVFLSQLGDLPRLRIALDELATQGCLVVADERRGLGAGVAGGCAALGVEAHLVVLGDSLFGGLPGGVVGAAADLLAAGDALGGLGPSTAPNPLSALAALETLRLADAAALRRVDGLAARLRDRWGGGGVGNAASLPAGLDPAALAATGVLVGPGGTAWLATVAGDADVAELAEAVDQARARA